MLLGPVLLAEDVTDTPVDDTELDTPVGNVVSVGRAVFEMKVGATVELPLSLVEMFQPEVYVGATNIDEEGFDNVV